MNPSAVSLLQPVAAMALLTLSVGVVMYLRRVAEMRERRIHPQQLDTRAAASGLLADTRASDHWANLFELPLLFHAACFTALLADAADVVYVALAWAFVVSRAVHAAIHLTVNRVLWRFYAFIAGFAILVVFWARLAVHLFPAP